MGNYTFSIIKPNAVIAGNTGKIIDIIETAGYTIVSLKKLKLSKEQASKFYFVHEAKPFFEKLTNFMSSDSIIAMILKKENAVEDFRELIGATDPAQAAEGTIRKLFAASKEENAIHASDSDENALVESSFFFSNLERF